MPSINIPSSQALENLAVTIASLEPTQCQEDLLFPIQAYDRLPLLTSRLTADDKSHLDSILLQHHAMSVCAQECIDPMRVTIHGRNVASETITRPLYDATRFSLLLESLQITFAHPESMSNMVNLVPQTLKTFHNADADDFDSQLTQVEDLCAAVYTVLASYWWVLTEQYKEYSQHAILGSKMMDLAQERKDAGVARPLAPLDRPTIHLPIPSFRCWADLIQGVNTTQLSEPRFDDAPYLKIFRDLLCAIKTAAHIEQPFERSERDLDRIFEHLCGLGEAGQHYQVAINLTGIQSLHDAKLLLQQWPQAQQKPQQTGGRFSRFKPWLLRRAGSQK